MKNGIKSKAFLRVLSIIFVVIILMSASLPVFADSDTEETTGSGQSAPSKVADDYTGILTDGDLTPPVAKVAQFLRDLGVFGILGFIFALVGIAALIILVTKIIVDMLIVIIGAGFFADSLTMSDSLSRTQKLRYFLLQYSTFTPRGMSNEQGISKIPPDIGTYLKEKWLVTLISFVAVVVILSGQIWDIAAGLIVLSNKGIDSAKNLIPTAQSMTKNNNKDSDETSKVDPTIEEMIKSYNEGKSSYTKAQVKAAIIALVNDEDKQLEYWPG